MASEERFGYEWRKFPDILPEYEVQFLKWVFPISKKDFKDKTILDAGCGTGRNSYWPLNYGARMVVAFDYDQRTVAVAKRNLAKFKNCHVRFGNIYEIPEKEKFDFSYAIGVIPHLDYPELAIEQLVKATKKGGTILIWVLSYEGNEWIVKYFNPIRFFTSRMSVSIVNRISLIAAIPLYLWIHLLPVSNIYLKQLKTFRLSHIHSIIFDHMLPKESHYYKKDEL